MTDGYSLMVKVCGLTVCLAAVYRIPTRPKKKRVSPTATMASQSKSLPPPPSATADLHHPLDLCALDMNTVQLHADHAVEPELPDISPAIRMSTTFRSGNPQGLVYSRMHMPTRSRAEEIIGALE